MKQRALSIPLIVVLTSACGGNTPGEAVRPKDQTYASAMGESHAGPGGGAGGPCHEVEATGEPLVVDWKPEQRGDLEVLMKEAVAVVAYKCDGLKLLKDCKVDGKYGFLGMSKKEQVVHLTNADEVKANLPLGGAGIAANISGEMQRGATLDVALIMIGKVKTTYGKVATDELKGECAGATHFVKGATVGAFVMDTGAKGNVRTAAQLFSAGASAGSSSTKSVRNQDGDLTDCAKANPSAPQAPPQCQSLVRLELKQIEPKAAAAKPGEKPAPPPPEKPKEVAEAEAAVAETKCPKGLVMAEGKCTEPKAAAAYQCKKTNGNECVEQCGKKHAGSCFAAGLLFQQGSGGLSRDPAKAKEHFQKGCDGGETKSCTYAGIMMYRGQGGSADPAGAQKIFDKSCIDGDALGCSFLGDSYLKAKDEKNALAAFTRGCEGGDDTSCGGAGRILLAKGPSQDPKKAQDYLKRGCDGNDAAACSDLGQTYEQSRNMSMAKFAYMRGCTRGNGAACANQGRAELGQQGNADSAKRAFSNACMFQSPIGCAAMKVLYGENRPFIPPSDAMSIQQSCTSGNMRDCGITALFSAARGDKAGADIHANRACMMPSSPTSDPLACAVKGKK